MGAMKRFAEDVSEELGYDGEINGDVINEAHRRLDQAAIEGRNVAVDFRVFIVHGLYTGEGDGNGRFVFPVGCDGELILSEHQGIARLQRANYNACRNGSWKGFPVSPIFKTKKKAQ